MSEERKKYLAICQTCTKSKFDRTKGLICSLTNEHATFNLNNDCPDYATNEKLTRIQSAAKKRVAVAQDDDSTSSFWRIFSVLFIIVGALLCIYGFSRFFEFIRYGFSAIDLFLSVSGLVIFSKGFIEFNKLKPSKNSSVKKINDDFDDIDEII